MIYFQQRFFFIGQVMLRKDKFYLKSACNNIYKTSSCKPLTDRFSNIFDVLYVTIAGKVNVISKLSFCKQETVLIDDAHLHVLHVIQMLSTKAIYSISLYDCVAIASIINTDRFCYYLFITIGKMCGFTSN
jgi:hypothetical protein